LSTLSHELRTPLNAILGWTQILQMEELDGEVAHGLEVIERNARAQTKLIEDLLDVSRISTGKLRIVPRIVPLSQVIHAAVESVLPGAEEKGVAIAVHLPDAPVKLAADPDRLQQVIWNLLSNAVKFTPGGGRVEVRAEQDGPHVRVRVADSGRGIDPTFLPHVFDRFRQADSTSTRSHGGLGIGLAIVRHIVELHGGTVKAESAGEGRGSVFTVTLPVAAAVEAQAGGAAPMQLMIGPGGRAAGMSVGAPAPMDAAHGRAPGAEDQELAGLRILIVDDEPDAREVLRRIIERARADVETAGSVAEARDAISRTRWDLIVSDIAMPDEDGYALMEYLRTAPPGVGGGTPAIALTAYAREDDRQRALDAGFADHVAKPVEPHDLVSAIARAVNGARDRTPARSAG
jgi:CheY-like chemotaxis protein/anti-sigma regulatory factor (Ser/Thr protein kinase)